MAEVPFLETERLQLFPVGDGHATERYLGWLNDKETNRYLETGRFPISLDQLKGFINGVRERGALFLAIHVKQDGTQIGNIKTDSAHIGNIKIDSFEFLHRRAEYGVLIGDKGAWGKGYAAEASEAVLRHCFRRMNLRKITLGVVADHTTALRLYEGKLRFKREGQLREHVYSDGQFRDVIRMATFCEDWRE